MRERAERRRCTCCWVRRAVEQYPHRDSKVCTKCDLAIQADPFRFNQRRGRERRSSNQPPTTLSLEIATAFNGWLRTA